MSLTAGPPSSSIAVKQYYMYITGLRHFRDVDRTFNNSLNSFSHAQWSHSLPCFRRAQHRYVIASIIFHVRPKKVDKNTKLMLDSNIPNTPFNPELIFEIERIHNFHANPSLRSFKLLGIHFDEHLNFNANTNALISKLSRSIFFINRVKHTLTPKALKSLLYMCVMCQLFWASHIYWGEPCSG